MNFADKAVASNHDYGNLPPLLKELSVVDLGGAVRVGDIILPKRRQNGRIVSGIPEHFVFTPFDLRRWLVLAEAIAYNKPTLIQGGAGTGKTLAVAALAEALNYPCYIINCSTTPIEDIIGKAWPSQDKKRHPSGFCFQPGPAYRALKEGGILCFDEWNYAKDEIRGRLHPFFDAALNPHSVVTIQENESEILKPHPDFRLLGLQNPPGEGFRGRKPLDEPQYGRWTFVNEPLDMSRDDKLLHWLGCMKQIFEPACVDNNEALAETGRQFIDACAALSKMIEEEVIARDEAQKPYITFRRELAKIKEWLVNRPQVDFIANLRDAMWREILRKFRPGDQEAVWGELQKIDYHGPKLKPQFKKGGYKAALSNQTTGREVTGESRQKQLESHPTSTGALPALRQQPSIGASDDGVAARLQRKLAADSMSGIRDALRDLGM